MARQKHASLFDAIAAVQAERPVVRKDGSNDYVGSRYATLEAVSEAVFPILAKHGLVWVTMPVAAGDGMALTYRLWHESGESLEGSYPIQGGQPQQVGSAITYARRYALCAVLGITPTGDDDDANAARAVTEPPEAGEKKPKRAGKTWQARIDACADVDALRGVWESANRAGLLYAELPSGEVMRDVLAARSAVLRSDAKEGSGE